VGEALLRKQNPKELLRSLCENAKEVLSAESASIWLRRIDKVILASVAGAGISTGIVGRIQYDLGEGLTGHAALGIPFRGTWESAQADPEWRGVWHSFRSNGISSTPGSILAVPIFHRGECVGVFRADNKIPEGMFSEKDQRLLESLADVMGYSNFAGTFDPTPFAFVLMPFAREFRDTYEFGIKAAGKALGMACDRIDDMEFSDNILQRIYASIERSDIIIADMTSKNPNVFYEVGYAHALSKEVILLTQREDDIPFDLKTHNHIIYESIGDLRGKLEKRIRAFLLESEGRRDEREGLG